MADMSAGAIKRQLRPKKLRKGRAGRTWSKRVLTGMFRKHFAGPPLACALAKRP